MELSLGFPWSCAHDSFSRCTRLTLRNPRVDVKQLRTEVREVGKGLTAVNTQVVGRHRNSSMQTFRELIFQAANSQATLRWLVTTDPSPNHNQARHLHEHHTGQWILRSREWKSWLAGSTRFLWLYGIPGAGKTVLASFLIDEVQGLVKRTSTSTGWCYYYCYHARNQDETTHFLRWIINQQARQSSGIPQEVDSLYQNGLTPNVSNLMKALQASLSSFESVFVVVDALDESADRENFISTLRKLGSEPSFNKIHIIHSHKSR